MATPTQRSMAATVAAHAMHAQGKTNTTAGRQVFMSRFEHQVDPDGKLDPRTRAIRAAHARKAYFTNLSLKASRARSERAKSPTTGGPKTTSVHPSTAADAAGVSRDVAGGRSASRRGSSQVAS